MENPLKVILFDSLEEQMEYLVKNEKLELKYEPGKGAWTYHILIPNTKHIVGRWGSLKVSGFLDDYKIEAKNLFTIKDQDKRIAVNDTIRKAIKKGCGDMVTVSLYLLYTNQKITEKQILDTFIESEVLNSFESLLVKERSEILNSIISQKNEEKQIKMIVNWIEKLSLIK